MAKINAQQSPKSYSDRDFSSEDTVPFWRAVGVFGGLLLAEGVVVWMSLGGPSAGSFSLSGGLGSPVFSGPGIVLLGMAFLLLLGGVAVVYFGFTEEGVAVFCAAATGVAVPYFFPLTVSPGLDGTDVGVVLGLLAVGTVLLGIGVARVVKAYRSLSEQAPAAPAP